MRRKQQYQHVSADISILLSEVEQDDFLAVCKRRKIDPAIFPRIDFTDVPAKINLDLVSDEVIFDEFQYRDLLVGDWLERTYRYLAEYDVEAAMDELHRQFARFGLAPPSTERQLVDLLSGTKGSSNVRN